ncbi:hypothetical protein JCM18899A_14070 [Nocardioides sp. AN3]
MTVDTRARAAREAKLEALHQELTTAVAGLVTGEDWKRAMTFAAQFRSRSFNNSMLIYAQHAAAYQQGRVPEPTPTYVAGFKQWLTLGRAVIKGQHGYGIFAPVTARFATTTPSDPGSWRRLARGEKPGRGEVALSRMVGQRPAYVWDVSQTQGDPIPEPPRPTLLQGQAPEGLWDGLADQITGHGYELRLVSTARVIGGANGLTDFGTREVSVRMDMDETAQVKTLAHELGHVVLHAPAGIELAADLTVDAGLHRGVAEVEAESVALMVAAAHGLDTSSYTVPYVSSWATSVPGKSPVEVVQATAERVCATALGILATLDTTQLGDGDPPGLDRDAPANRYAPPISAAARHDAVVLGR